MELHFPNLDYLALMIGEENINFFKRYVGLIGNLNLDKLLDYYNIMVEENPKYDQNKRVYKIIEKSRLKQSVK